MLHKTDLAMGALRHADKARPGRCPCCSRLTFYVQISDRPIREVYWCVRCRSTGRNRLLALGLIRELGVQRLDAIEKAGRSPREIYIAAASGPIFTRIPVGTPGVTTSDFVPSVPLGAVLPDSVSTCQNLESLTYGNDSFDVVVTEDVLEHVRDPDACFSEIFRVLRPGGSHIFTVPWQPQVEQIKRVDTSGPEDVKLLPDEWHGDVIRGRILAYRTFGYGIFDQMARHGFETELLLPSVTNLHAGIHDTFAFIARKPG